MKVLLLLGHQTNQKALAAKIAARHEVVGIVYEQRKSKPTPNISYFFTKIADKLFFNQLKKAWINMLGYYNSFTSPAVSVYTTPWINDAAVADFIKKKQPELIVVSGTSLIKPELIALAPKKGMMNLHTGLSPYVRGGPNCTNWCIANNTVHLIGNTVMWIDKGIDSGNIIASETVKFNGDELLEEIHIKVMEHAHDLTLRTIDALENNFANCASVNQKNIAPGELFLSRMWNFRAKMNFIRSIKKGKFKEAILDPSYAKKQAGLVTVKLPSEKKQTG